MTTIYEEMGGPGHQPGHAAGQPRQHLDPIPDTMPMHERVTATDKSLAQLWAVVRDLEAANANLREVIARELGL